MVLILLAEKSFEEGVEGIWNNLKRIITEAIVKTVVEEQAAAVIRIAAEKAVAAVKSLSAYSGIPFVGLALGIAAVAAVSSEIEKHRTAQGGMERVPGPEGAPVQITAHGGERIVTSAQQRREGGGSGAAHRLYAPGC